MATPLTTFHAGLAGCTGTTCGEAAETTAGVQKLLCANSNAAWNLTEALSTARTMQGQQLLTSFGLLSAASLPLAAAAAGSEVWPLAPVSLFSAGPDAACWGLSAALAASTGLEAAAGAIARSSSALPAVGLDSWGLAAVLSVAFFSEAGSGAGGSCLPFRMAAHPEVRGLGGGTGSTTCNRGIKGEGGGVPKPRRSSSGIVHAAYRQQQPTRLGTGGWLSATTLLASVGALSGCCGVASTAAGGVSAMCRSSKLAASEKRDAGAWHLANVIDG